MLRFSREQLRCELERVARVPIQLTLTSNASSYITFQPGEKPLRVRVQRIFQHASDDVVVALGRWLGGREARCPRVVRRFINNPPPEAADLVRTRRRRLQVRGRCYDLAKLLARVNDEWFGGAVTARITWGRRAGRRSVQARTLGSYCRTQDLIVLHPVLDQWEVPEWFVVFTIYHECLHAFQGSGERPHNRAFYERLRKHPHYSAALKWEKANLRLLTRGRQSGRRAAWRVDRKKDAPPEEPGQMRFRW